MAQTQNVQRQRAHGPHRGGPTRQQPSKSRACLRKRVHAANHRATGGVVAGTVGSRTTPTQTRRRDSPGGYAFRRSTSEAQGATKSCANVCTVPLNSSSSSSLGASASRLPPLTRRASAHAAAAPPCWRPPPLGSIWEPATTTSTADPTSWVTRGLSAAARPAASRFIARGAPESGLALGWRDQRVLGGCRDAQAPRTLHKGGVPRPRGRHARCRRPSVVQRARAFGCTAARHTHKSRVLHTRGCPMPSAAAGEGGRAVPRAAAAHVRRAGGASSLPTPTAFAALRCPPAASRRCATVSSGPARPLRCPCSKRRRRCHTPAQGRRAAVFAAVEAPRARGAHGPPAALFSRRWLHTPRTPRLTAPSAAAATCCNAGDGGIFVKCASVDVWGGCLRSGWPAVANTRALMEGPGVSRARGGAGDVSIDVSIASCMMQDPRGPSLVCAPLSLLPPTQPRHGKHLPCSTPTCSGWCWHLVDVSCARYTLGGWVGGGGGGGKAVGAGGGVKGQGTTSGEKVIGSKKRRGRRRTHICKCHLSALGLRLQLLAPPAAAR